MTRVFREESDEFFQFNGTVLSVLPTDITSVSNNAVYEESYIRSNAVFAYRSKYSEHKLIFTLPISVNIFHSFDPKENASHADGLKILSEVCSFPYHFIKSNRVRNYISSRASISSTSFMMFAVDEVNCIHDLNVPDVVFAEIHLIFVDHTSQVQDFKFKIDEENAADDPNQSALFGSFYSFGYRERVSKAFDFLQQSFVRSDKHIDSRAFIEDEVTQMGYTMLLAPVVYNTSEIQSGHNTHVLQELRDLGLSKKVIVSSPTGEDALDPEVLLRSNKGEAGGLNKDGTAKASYAESKNEFEIFWSNFHTLSFGGSSSVQKIKISRKNKLAKHYIGSRKYPFVQYMGRYPARVELSLQYVNHEIYKDDFTGLINAVNQLTNVLDYNNEFYPEISAYNVLKLRNLPGLIMNVENIVPNQTFLTTSAQNQGTEIVHLSFIEADMDEFMDVGLHFPGRALAMGYNADIALRQLIKYFKKLTSDANFRANIENSSQREKFAMAHDALHSVITNIEEEFRGGGATGSGIRGYLSTNDVKVGTHTVKVKPMAVGMTAIGSDRAVLINSMVNESYGVIGNSAENLTPSEMVELISNLSTKQLLHIAKSGGLIFDPGIDKAEVGELLDEEIKNIVHDIHTAFKERGVDQAFVNIVLPEEVGKDVTDKWKSAFQIKGYHRFVYLSHERETIKRQLQATGQEEKAKAITKEEAMSKIGTDVTLGSLRNENNAYLVALGRSEETTMEMSRAQVVIDAEKKHIEVIHDLEDKIKKLETSLTYAEGHLDKAKITKEIEQAKANLLIAKDNAKASTEAAKADIARQNDVDDIDSYSKIWPATRLILPDPPYDPSVFSALLRILEDRLKVIETTKSNMEAQKTGAEKQLSGVGTLARGASSVAALDAVYTFRRNGNVEKQITRAHTILMTISDIALKEVLTDDETGQQISLATMQKEVTERYLGTNLKDLGIPELDNDPNRNAFDFLTQYPYFNRQAIIDTYKAMQAELDANVPKAMTAVLGDVSNFGFTDSSGYWSAPWINGPTNFEMGGQGLMEWDVVMQSDDNTPVDMLGNPIDVTQFGINYDSGGGGVTESSYTGEFPPHVKQALGSLRGSNGTNILAGYPANLRALADLVSRAEGTHEAQGKKGYGEFSGYNEKGRALMQRSLRGEIGHPTNYNGTRGESSAAGRYQAMGKTSDADTWRATNLALGKKGFDGRGDVAMTVKNQDEFFIQKLKDRGLYTDALAGNWDRVINNISIAREWASFPVNNYNKKGYYSGQGAKGPRPLYIEALRHLTLYYNGAQAGASVGTSAVKVSNQDNSVSGSNPKMFFGDSIAFGVGFYGENSKDGKNKVKAVVGHDSSKSLNQINNAGSQVKGQSVFLSSGVSNDLGRKGTGTPNYENVELQVKALIANGAKDITLAGISNELDKRSGKNVNAKLQEIATKYNVKFSGGFQPNGNNAIHPEYKSYARQVYSGKYADGTAIMPAKSATENKVGEKTEVKNVANKVKNVNPKKATNPHSESMAEAGRRLDKAMSETAYAYAKQYRNAAWFSSDPHQNPNYRKVIVLEVADGDTAYVLTNTGIETIRYSHIDALETPKFAPIKGSKFTIETTGQPGAVEQTDRVRALMPVGTELYLNVERKDDVYKRTLGEFVDKDGKSINTKLIDEGIISANPTMLVGNKHTNTKYSKAELAKKQQEDSRKAKEYREKVTKLEKLAKQAKTVEELKSLIKKNPDVASIVNLDTLVETASLSKNGKEAQAKAKEASDNRRTSTTAGTPGNRLVGYTGNTGSGTGPHLHINYARHWASSKGAGAGYWAKIQGKWGPAEVRPEHIARFTAGGKPLSEWRVTSTWGRRNGSGQVSAQHFGTDYGTPTGTEIRTTYAVERVTTFFQPGGGGRVNSIHFSDGVVVNIAHLEDRSKSLAGGSSAGLVGTGVDGVVTMEDALNEGQLAQQFQESPPKKPAHRLKDKPTLENRLSVYNEQGAFEIQSHNMVYIQRHGLDIALPAIKVYVVVGNEVEDPYLGGSLMPNHYFEINGIRDFRVVCNNDENPVDVATFAIANASFIKTDNYAVLGQFISRDVDSIGTNAEYSFIADRIRLRPGVKLHIRMGYGNDPNKLRTVFNGILTDMVNSQGVTLQCIAEGYGRELLLDQISPQKPQQPGGMFTNDSTPLIISTALGNREGIAHFGNRSTFWESVGAFISPFIPLVGIRAHDYSDPENKRLTTIYFDTSYRPGNYKQRLFVNIYSAEVEKLHSEFNSTWWNRLGNLFSFIKASGYVYLLHGQTPWAVLKEMEYRHPGTFAKPLFYGDRMTMFYGLKEQMYIARDLEPTFMQLVGETAKEDAKTNAEYLKVRPLRYDVVCGFHFLSSEINIIRNNIAINSNYKTQVNVVYFEDKEDKVQEHEGDDLKEFKMKIDDNLASFEHRSMTVNMLGIHSKYMSYMYGITALRKEAEKMYGGTITIVGNPCIKAGDFAYLSDNVRRFNGLIKIRECKHIMSEQHGFVTEITPGLYVEPASFIYSTLFNKLGFIARTVMAHASLLNQIAANDEEDFKMYVEYLRARTELMNYTDSVTQGVLKGTSFLAATIVGANLFGLRNSGLPGAQAFDKLKALGAEAVEKTKNLGRSGVSRVGSAMATSASNLPRGVRRYSRYATITTLRTLRNLKSSKGISGFLLRTGGGIVKLGWGITKIATAVSLRVLFAGLRVFSAALFTNPIGWLVRIAGALVFTYAAEKLEELELTRQPLLVTPILYNGRPYSAGMTGYNYNTFFESVAENWSTNWAAVSKYANMVEVTSRQAVARGIASAFSGTNQEKTRARLEKEIIQPHMKNIESVVDTTSAKQDKL